MNSNLESQKKIRSQKGIFTWIIILLIIVLITGISYAVIEIISTGAKENTIKSGSITFSYTENQNAINISNASAINDDTGKLSNNYFDFNLTGSGTGNVKISYYIYFTVDSSSTLDLDSIKLYLTKNNSSDIAIANETEVVAPILASECIPINLDTLTYDITSDKYLLYSNNFTFNNDSTIQVHYYRFRMWLNNNSNNSITITGDNDTKHEAIVSGKTFKLKINVYGVNGELKQIFKA